MNVIFFPCECCSSGWEGSRDSAVIHNAERSLGFKFEVDVYKGMSRSFRLLCCGWMKCDLLSSVLLHKALLRCLSQTVFLLFLFLLQKCVWLLILFIPWLVGLFVCVCVCSCCYINSLTGMAFFLFTYETDKKLKEVSMSICLHTSFFIR